MDSKEWVMTGGNLLSLGLAEQLGTRRFVIENLRGLYLLETRPVANLRVSRSPWLCYLIVRRASSGRGCVGLALQRVAITPRGGLETKGKDGQVAMRVM
jgi:hypothetical protein